MTINNPLVITPQSLDYGNTKRADLTAGYFVTEVAGGYLTPGNTVPGVTWETHINTATIPNEVIVASQLDSNPDDINYPSYDKFIYSNPRVLHPSQVAVVYVPDKYNNIETFADIGIQSHWNDEKAILEMTKRHQAEKYANKLLLTQHSFELDVDNLPLPYTTFVYLSSRFIGNITFLNSNLGDTTNQIPMLNNCAYDNNYGNIVNQVSVDINGKPTITPTRLVFVKDDGSPSDTKKIYYARPLYKNGSTSYDDIVYDVLPLNQPLGSDGKPLGIKGYWVDTGV